MRFNINRKISLALIGFTLMASTGCEKFLDAGPDPSNLNPDDYYTTPEHATAAIAAAYAQTRFIGGGTGIFANNFQMLDAVTGTVGTETGQNSDLNNLLGLAYNGDNAFVNNWWNGLYNLVAQTNLVIENVPGIQPMDEAQKKKILGEAYFLRAYSYFYLVRLWGDVPLITKPQTTSSPDFYPTRASQEEVYNLIVQDLKTAEESGLGMTDGSGRASLGAVKSLLAKVYLTMAGEPLKKGTSHYQLAADKALEVINSNAFSLFTKYADLHNPSMENKGEQIFQIQYLVGVADNPMQAIMLPNFKDISKFGTEVGSMVPVKAFYDSYEAGDLRTAERVGFFYTSYFDKGDGALRDLSSLYIYKHFDSVGHGTSGRPGTGNSSLNWNQLRYAEVLLTYAEAQNEAGGSPNADAVAALKAIRDRANLTTPTTFTQDEFRQAVWRERWYELCFEGVSWFDMVRLKKVFNTTTKGFDSFVGHSFPGNGATLQEKHLLFPLPTSEMQNNQNLRPNNPGY
ncbi:RagB/SusD family nutrient uptake outer membrane protein [Flavihumibacter solisilvae]|uniref:Carbohydrate-binding protein SusD n=1 Tax=Flavihumibacter solisilvae TaxID=1349421 RepID=A0A0C1J0I3_9BACT|nr:RagB/SusD family nutrient uptake outer membrane protein [Flavihumibacter solisilvae]KIC96279.1 carbohydrate-binding protein SusD [Flavihumibacter solisilvae]